MEKPDNLTIVHIGVMIIMLTACAVCIGISVASAKSYYTDINANYEKVYAMIVRYELTNGRYDYNKSYSTFYEYEADGIVYSGIWQRLIYDEEDAKSMVGKKVPIYVDHTLKHHVKSLKTPTVVPVWVAGALSIAFFGIFLNSFIREIIYIVRWKKYKKELQIHTSI